MEALQRGETPEILAIETRREPLTRDLKMRYPNAERKAARKARHEARVGVVSRPTERAEFISPEAAAKADKRAQRALRAAQRTLTAGDAVTTAPSHIREKIRAVVSARP